MRLWKNSWGRLWIEPIEYKKIPKKYSVMLYSFGISLCVVYTCISIIDYFFEIFH